MQQKKLAGKIAIITGSSRGIGRAIALCFAREGAITVVCYHKEKKRGLGVAKEIEGIGKSALLVQLNIASLNSIHKLVRKTLEIFKRVDILVNNAGYLNQNNFEDITEQDYDKTLNVNLKGAFFLSQAVWPFFEKQKSGKIINIASVGGQYGGPKAPHYSAAKAGIISLTKSLARLGAPNNILVNCVSPGQIETDMTKEIFRSQDGKKLLSQIPLNRIGRSEEVANVVLFLASRDASYITGQTINVNGGFYL